MCTPTEKSNSILRTVSFFGQQKNQIASFRRWAAINTACATHPFGLKPDLLLHSVSSRGHFHVQTKPTESSDKRTCALSTNIESINICEAIVNRATLASAKDQAENQFSGKATFAELYFWVSHLAKSQLRQTPNLHSHLNTFDGQTTHTHARYRLLAFSRCNYLIISIICT